MEQDGNASRIASTTESVRIASPIRLRRVTSTRRGATATTDSVSRVRGSSTNAPLRIGRAEKTDLADQIGRRVPLGVADDGRADPQRLRDRPLGNALHGVVRSFRMHLRTDPAQERFHRILLEEGHPVDALERRHELEALLQREERAPASLELPSRGVGVQGDEEGLARLLRALEIADVPHVKEVEDAVGEHESLALRGIPVEAFLQ